MFLRHALAIAGLFFALSTFAQCEYTEVNFTTTTALYPWETGWELYQVGENEATLIVSFQGSIEGTFSTQTCLEDGCYYFLATDSWGDGWNGTTLTADVDLDGFEGAFTIDEGFFAYLPFTIGDVACTGPRGRVGLPINILMIN